MQRIYIDQSKDGIQKTIDSLKDLNSTVFIYPTDTIYGLGANAESLDLVKKINSIKHRVTKAGYSIVPPDFEWITKNLVLNEVVIQLILNSPSKQTFILKKKNREYLKHIAIDNLAIRITSDPFSNLLSSSINAPIVSTSVNISGQSPIKNYDEMSGSGIETDNISYFFDIGTLDAAPSSIYDCSDLRTIIKIR